ncbi:MAG: PEP-CTERM sorting domain-containing protein [Gammaproteobacteria bacterium]
MIALTLGGIAFGATADPVIPTILGQSFTIDINSNTQGVVGPDDGVTGLIEKFGYANTVATSFYYPTPCALDPVSCPNGVTFAAPGSLVRDTNINSVITAMGGPAAGTALDGSTAVSINTLTALDQYNIDTLSPLSGIGGDDIEGFDTSWGLFYQYDIFGNVNGAGTAVNFNSGYIDLYWFKAGALAAAEKVLSVNVTSSQTDPSNTYLFGEVDYSWCDPGDSCSAFVKSFMNSDPFNDSFYNIWKSATPPPEITFILDTNVAPPVPTTDQLLLLTGTDPSMTLDCNPLAPGAQLCNAARQTSTSGGVEFGVPEPTSLGLMGLGMFAAGLRARRRRSH